MAEVARLTGVTVAVVRRLVEKLDRQAMRLRQEEIARLIDSQPTLTWPEKVARWQEQTGQSEATFWRVLQRIHGKDQST